MSASTMTAVVTPLFRKREPSRMGLRRAVSVTGDPMGLRPDSTSNLAFRKGVQPSLHLKGQPWRQDATNACQATRENPGRVINAARPPVGVGQQLATDPA